VYATKQFGLLCLFTSLPEPLMMEEPDGTSPRSKAALCSFSLKGDTARLIQAAVTWQNTYKSTPHLAKAAAWDCCCYANTQTVMASKGFPLPKAHHCTWTSSDPTGQARLGWLPFGQGQGDLLLDQIQLSFFWARRG